MRRFFHTLKYLLSLNRARRIGAICLVALTLLLPLETYAISFADIALTGGGFFGGCKVGAVVGALGAAAGGITIVTAPVASALGCVIGGIGGGIAGYFLADSIIGTLIKWVAGLAVIITTIVTQVLLGWAAELLRVGVQLSTQSISHFGPVDSAVQVSAGIANLILVGIFVFIGLATILDIWDFGGGYSMRKTLPMLIVVVLIVNFSGVFVGLLVDAGNTVMRFFWENSNLQSVNISEYIVQNMKISQALTSLSQKDVERLFSGGSLQGTSTELGLAGIEILVMLLALYAAYIFLRLAIILIMRVGAIWLLLITAPLVFTLGILPKMRSYLHTWWHELLNWAFIGPITFFFFFFGLAIWGELNRTFAQELQKATGQDVQGLSLFLIFPIVAFFFSYALSASKKMAGAAANGVIDGVIGIGKGVALGGLALTGGAILAGTGARLGRTLRSERVGKAAGALERAGFSKASQFIKGQRDTEIKKHDEQVKRRQAAYKDLAEKDPKKLEQEFDNYNTGKPGRAVAGLTGLVGGGGLADSEIQRAGIIHAMLEAGQPLSEGMKNYGLSRGKTTDAALGKAVKEIYPDLDSDVYNKATGTIIPTTGYKKIVENFRKAKDQWRINLDGFSDTPPVGPGLLTPKQEALLLLAPHLDKGDRNKIATNPDLLGKYRTMVNSISATELLDGSRDAIFSDLAHSSGFSTDYLRDTFNQLHKWVNKNAADNLANTFRNAPAAQQNNP